MFHICYKPLHYVCTCTGDGDYRDTEMRPACPWTCTVTLILQTSSSQPHRFSVTGSLFLSAVAYQWHPHFSYTVLSFTNSFLPLTIVYEIDPLFQKVISFPVTITALSQSCLSSTKYLKHLWRITSTAKFQSNTPNSDTETNWQLMQS